MSTGLERDSISSPLLSSNEVISKLANLADTPHISLVRSALGAEEDLYFVGGTVRDMFWGLDPLDIDFASRLTPGALVEKCESAGIRIIPTGKRHQTVTVVPLPGSNSVEITTFRSAGMSPNSGLVTGSSIEEDLKFRDFSVNALAYSLNGKQLIGDKESFNDLQSRLLKAVGDPTTRILEDPLRSLRLLRIACEHNLSIDEETFKSTAANISLLSGVSAERIRDELVRIILSPQPGRGMRLLEKSGALKTILPEIQEFVGYEQNRFHRLDLFEHTIAVIENSESDEILRLAALFHDVGKPPTLSIDAETGDRHFFKHETVGAEIAKAILLRLRFPHSTVDAVTSLIETHMRPLEAGPGGLRRLLRDVGSEYERWRKLKEADARGCIFDENEFAKRIKRFDEAMAEVKKGPAVSPLKSLAINGHDVTASGFPPGPQVGIILRALHEQVLDNPELNTREQLLSMIDVMVKKN